MICDTELELKNLITDYNTVIINNDTIIENTRDTHFNFHDKNVDIDNITIEYSDIHEMYGEDR
jgi:penicillin V acylase-like amidase (Ntn superfamily)